MTPVTYHEISTVQHALQVLQGLQSTHPVIHLQQPFHNNVLVQSEQMSQVFVLRCQVHRH